MEEDQTKGNAPVNGEVKKEETKANNVTKEDQRTVKPDSKFTNLKKVFDDEEA